MTDPISAMAKRLRQHDEFGAMHIVVSDGNVEDGNIEFCLSLPEATDDDRALARDLLAMSKLDREAAWQIAGLLSEDA